MLIHIEWATDEHGFVRCNVDTPDGPPVSIAIVSASNGLYMVSFARGGKLLERHRHRVAVAANEDRAAPSALETVQEAALKAVGRMLGVGAC